MKVFNYIGITFAGLFLSSMATAGPSNAVIYAPQAMQQHAIPTLSGTMLVLLSLLLVAVAFRISKTKNSGTPMVLVGGLVIGAVLSVTGGVKLISEVNASGGGGNTPIHLDNPSGGQALMSPNELNIFENTSGLPQIIQNILTNPPGGFFCPNNNLGVIDGVSRCEIGAVVPTTMDGLCYVDCRSIIQSN